MARYVFGPQLVVKVQPDGSLVAAQNEDGTGTIWLDSSRSTQLTDLLALDGTSIAAASTDNDGRTVPFRGPDGERGPLLADWGDGVLMELRSPEAEALTNDATLSLDDGSVTGAKLAPGAVGLTAMEGGSAAAEGTVPHRSGSTVVWAEPTATTISYAGMPSTVLRYHADTGTWDPRPTTRPDVQFIAVRLVSDNAPWPPIGGTTGAVPWVDMVALVSVDAVIS